MGIEVGSAGVGAGSVAVAIGAVVTMGGTKVAVGEGPTTGVCVGVGVKGGMPGVAVGSGGAPVPIGAGVASVPGGTNVTLLCEDLPPGLRPEDNETGSRLSLEQLARRFENGAGAQGRASQSAGSAKDGRK